MSENKPVGHHRHRLQTANWELLTTLRLCVSAFSVRSSSGTEFE
jgi:hypothetical protein